MAASLEGVRLDPRVVAEAYAALAARYDLVVVEAAGGALVPFSDGVNMAALASMLGLPVVVAARPGLGTLNHTLLTLEALHRRGLTVLGVVISGYPDEPGLDALTNPSTLARLTPLPLSARSPTTPASTWRPAAPAASRRSAPPGSTPSSGAPSRRPASAGRRTRGGTPSQPRPDRQESRWTRPTPHT